MVRPRWRKIAGDLRAARGRVALVVLALAVSLTALGTVLGARTVLRREIRASFLGSHPPEATLLIGEGVDAKLLAEVRGFPEIAEADAREVRMFRARVGDGPWRGLQLFVADDLAPVRLGSFEPESGAASPPPGAILVERSAVGVLGAGPGQTITIQTPHGATLPVAIVGTVHDGGLAPAWQEHRGYGYATRATLAALGEPPILHELRVQFRPGPTSDEEVETAALALAGRLAAAGHTVGDVRVPPLRLHPHESQMTTAQMSLLVFSVFLLVLAALLVATMLSAMLARQVREIGAMKATGARTGQLAVVYAGFVVGLGVLALIPALPLAHFGAQAFIQQIGRMMNLALADRSVPLWVPLVVVGAGLVFPLAAAALPILRACRLTVRAALAQHGVGADFIRPSLVRLPMAARNALRRPGRLALTLILLAVSGATAMVALDVERGYQRTTERMPDWIRADLDVLLDEPAEPSVVAAIAHVPGVRTVEAWGQSPATLGTDVAHPSPFFLVHTYPDQGHGSFALEAPPDGAELVRYPIVAGRWLAPGDAEVIVLDRVHAASLGVGIGGRVGVAVPGGAASLTVVGIIEAVPPMAAYVPPATLARLTGNGGRPRLLRIATAPDAKPIDVAMTLAHGLSGTGARVARVVPIANLRAAIDDHFVLLTRAAIILAFIIAAVGLAGLGAAMAVGVAERTREIGAMKAIGATGGRIFGLFVGEAALIGAASWVAGVALALPLTWAVEAVLARIGFLLPAFVVAPDGLAGWLVLAVGGSALAALIPARRAARLTVKDALAEV